MEWGALEDAFVIVSHNAEFSLDGSSVGLIDAFSVSFSHNLGAHVVQCYRNHKDSD